MQNTKTQKKKPAAKVLPKKTTAKAAARKSVVAKKKATNKKVVPRVANRNLQSRSNRSVSVAKSVDKKNSSAMRILRIAALFMILVATIVVFVKAFATKLEAPEQPIEKTQESITREIARPQSPPSVKNEDGLYRNEQMGIQFKYPEQKILVSDGTTSDEDEEESTYSIAAGMIYKDIPNKLFPSADLSDYMKQWDSSSMTRIEGGKQWFCTVVGGEKKGKKCYTQLGKTVYQFDYYQSDDELFTEDEFDEILKSVDIIG